MFLEKVFAERLKKLRESNGLTLKQLADNIDSTKATIGNLENCNKKPSLDMVLKLCNHFNISADYLLGLSDDSTRH